MANVPQIENDVSTRFEVIARGLGLTQDDFRNLKDRYTTTSEAVANARRDLIEAQLPACVDVLGLGSMGRYEMSSESDLDYLVVCHADDGHDHAAENCLADDLRNSVLPGVVLRPPGKTGLFGQGVSTSELFEIIGLDEDTNSTHSRRVLVLEESVSLGAPHLHDTLLRTMANRYIDAIPLGNFSVPRFLVNDLARYWRQLTVDYQAKSESGPSSLRRLKLLGPRKFTYASSVLALLTLELRQLDKAGIENRLVEVFKSPPSLRFLDEIAFLDKLEPGGEAGRHGIEAVRVMNEFSGLFSNRAWRERVESARDREEADNLPEFQKGRDLARKLQTELDSLFFSSHLEKLTRKYLVF